MNTTENKPQLYLYLISQTVNKGWDTYDSAVVCAESEEEARNTHPASYVKPGEWYLSNWTNSPEEVIVQYIGVATDGLGKGVICSSYNAG